MRRLIMDALNILSGMLAGFTSYLLLGFSKGFYRIDFSTMLLCALAGLGGGLLPTLWEIFASSRDIARVSHSWLAVGILLAVIHIVDEPLVDAACFGYLFHLFVDTRQRKLAPAIQLKSCNRKLAYGIIIFIYFLLLAIVFYARQHPPQGRL